MTNDEYTQAVDEGRWPEDCAVPLDDPFVNANGKIQNLVLKPMNSATAITSVKGAVRANHWHKTDWHYSYVASGRILYFERPVGSTEIPEPRSFGPGEMFFTPPNREHAMLFAEDTVFITFARNVRSHEKHEEDVVRMPFITPEIAADFLGPSRRVESNESVVITDDDGEPD